LDLEYNRQLRIVPRKFDVITSSSLSLGTGFSNLRQRVDVRFGKLNSLNQSAFFNSLVGSSEVTKHYYLFLGYGIESVFHNASIQGHLFGVEDPNKREAMPWVRHLRLGWAKSTASYTLKATYNWLSQEVRGRAGRHAFIGFELNVRVPAKTS
ncbi:MAG TPA: lipid A-modifier LpxR family protein, partial [Roseivirga sp.]